MSVSIRIEDLCKDFPATSHGSSWRALEHVNVSVEPGEFVTILGPSGCGKSTLLNVLSGLDTDFQGGAAIERDGQRTKKARIAYLFQEPRLLPWRTVRSNIEFAMDAVGIPSSEWAGRCTKWIELVGLNGFADFYPLQLSGGMQQRAAIARAFAVDPEILLMDEPFSALDELTARRMRQELLTLWEANRRTVLFVTHNSLEAVYLSDRILIMKKGPGSYVCDEVKLDHLARPRRYDDPAQYETQKDVLQRLMKFVS
ncbi:ABC transporter ATP-binding protein [Bradyrhizobium sp. AUGA SZCCT0182]|uniref:ABC transporter ATP-binding protein n=1 Tax=Bradyrhizobium sp. AUGA SZCCT0182 TaxID=2807667 RepID=UPI001BAD9D97|nr:ABC transporter ATP-binding protein [Bradyrhizobium sp. AUGA SZCCT0182]MBR1231744.1 ABC transporter ATP-binding protein [Bradyrhizobium sp. AUGA SZCCT0182]